MNKPTPAETVAKAKKQIEEIEEIIASGKLTPKEIEKAREEIGDIGLVAVVADILGDGQEARE